MGKIVFNLTVLTIQMKQIYIKTIIPYKTEWFRNMNTRILPAHYHK